MNTINPGNQFAAKITHLAYDLQRYVAGEQPSDHELDAAPLLLLWSPARRLAPCLQGLCSSHPQMVPGPILTSEVWWIDEAQGWARTTNRLYSLGTRKPST